jgi:putative ABC transport system substrate-binding protein
MPQEAAFCKVQVLWRISFHKPVRMSGKARLPRFDQAPAKLPTIGFLGPTTPAAQWIAAFLKRLRELGWIEGRNIAIEYRWAGGRAERFAEIAAEFVRLKVDVIVTSGTPAVLAAKQATGVIPIVFVTAGDPVGTGLVASLARPGGNVTGFSLVSADLAGKRVELLREFVPVSVG